MSVGETLPFPQVQLHRVLNSPHKWNSSKTLINLKKSILLRENVAWSHTLKHIENSLEHWITFIFITDSETVETKAAVFNTHHDKYFKLTIFLIKILILSVLVFNVQLFLSPILHHLWDVLWSLWKVNEINEINIWTTVRFSYKLHILYTSDNGLDVGRNW